MSGKKAEGRSGGAMEWINSACRFAADRNDFRSGGLGRKKPFRFRLDVSSTSHVVSKQQRSTSTGGAEVEKQTFSSMLKGLQSQHWDD